MQIEKNIAATLIRKMEAEQKTKMEFSKELGIPRSSLQGYLKGEKSLRSDSIEELAKSLDISPAQLISAPECTVVSKDICLDLVLLDLQTLHPQAQKIAKEAVSLLNTAFRISDELKGTDTQQTLPDPPTALYRYFLHETRGPFCMGYLYGILGKKRTRDGWEATSVVAPFSRNKTAVSCLVDICTELQLAPVHLPAVVQDFLAWTTLSP
jgi:transcriptional regulator with XRE-family HTH domain